MATELQLVELDGSEAQRWDALIAKYPGWSVFHQRAWLEYLAASRGVAVRHWAIRNGAQTLGYFCGGTLRRGPFRILGSPLRGWSTNFMGPVMHGAVDPAEFLAALDRLARAEGLAMIELEHRAFSEDLLERAGYESETSWTYRVALTPDDPEAMLKRMEKSRRYGVRKAIKLGLTAEDTSDAAIADEFYDQLTEVMRYKGAAPGYPREYVQLLVRHLKAAGRMFALRVRSPQGQLLATGLFPFDDHTVYMWGAASNEDGRKLYANDFLHWQAMSLAAERGLTAYDMSGWGRFKKEFGGELLTLKRWHKCYWRSAKLARRGYELYVKSGLRVRNWMASAQARAAQKAMQAEMQEESS
jgi:hypothetical protein